MKRIQQAGIGAFFAVVIFLAWQTKKPVKLSVQLHQTVFDTAILMLQEFVKGGDADLGFANMGEVLNAHISVTDGIEMYYLREDSLMGSNWPIDSQIVKLNRKIYPVFSGTKLCASVTFDSTVKGWQPLVFEDSTGVNAYLDDKAKGTAATPGRKPNYIIIVVPFLNENLVMEQSATGTRIVATATLERTMGETMPLVDIEPATNRKHISINLFTNGLKRYVHKIEGH
jgi:hypothetical protein